MGRQPVPQLVEFKGEALSAIAVLLRTADLELLSSALSVRLGDTPDFFSGELAVLDFSNVEAAVSKLDWHALCALFKQYNLISVAVRNVSPDLAIAAREAGLSVQEPLGEQRRIDLPEAVFQADEPHDRTGAVSVPALIVDSPLRSGQRIYAQGGDLIVLAMVNTGAEVIADGNIHVYAPLRGRALAGAKGNMNARIFTTSFEAELVSIAGEYRTFEQTLPKLLLKRPAQVLLREKGQSAEEDMGHSLVIEPLAIT